jgi:hypothetical protein
MEIGLLSNQDTVACLLEAWMQYQSCPLDPFFGLVVKASSHLLQLILQVLVACTPTFKRSQNNVGLEKKLSHITI